MNFEQGLKRLEDVLQLAGVTPESEEYLDFVGCQRQLLASIENERRYAVLAPQEQEHRERVLRELDRLALRYAGKTFLDLRVGRRIGDYVNESQNDIGTSKTDFIIVTALEEERDAVLNKLSGYQRVRPSDDDIRVYYYWRIDTAFPDGLTCNYHAVLMPLLGMGRVQATAATVDAIHRWHPRYVVLVGIAGGVAARGVNLGDVLVAEQVVDYELQKLTRKGPEVRWTVHQPDPRLLGAARNLRDSDWLALIATERPGGGAPTCHIGPIASGDKVIAFGAALAKYRKTWSKLIGTEMEAGGAAIAAFQAAEAPGFFMVRGVSDLADEEKNSEYVEKWRSYACDAAASYAMALLRSGSVPLA